MTTNNHPAHGPVSLERLHQISEILSKAAAQSDGGNLGYAMADAVKVIDGVISVFGNAPVAVNDDMAYAFHHALSDASLGADEVEEIKTGLRAALANVTAQPAPVVPEVMADPDESQYGGTYDEDYQAECAYVEGWNACRAAMLQAGNHTEQHLDMVDHSGDDNEKADCKLPFDQWLSQQNEPIDVDCGCVTTEAFYHWLRVAYEAGNSPVIGIDMAFEPDRSVEVRYLAPSGYVMVPKEITCAMDDAAWEAYHETRCMSDIWAALLAAAPQQEVK